MQSGLLKSVGATLLLAVCAKAQDVAFPQINGSSLVRRGKTCKACTSLKRRWTIALHGTGRFFKSIAWSRTASGSISWFSRAIWVSKMFGSTAFPRTRCGASVRFTGAHQSGSSGGWMDEARQGTGHDHCSSTITLYSATNREFDALVWSIFTTTFLFARFRTLSNCW